MYSTSKVGVVMD